ncbi:MAG: glycosyltransferase [Spirochaetia bacterium]|nr:glycosyltransferase [Spirochaetia bacterium]
MLITLSTMCLIWLMLFHYDLFKMFFILKSRLDFDSWVKKTKDQKTFSFPFVSIILPVRNEEANIEKCIDALLKIDYPLNKIEIIIVNDSSDDDTVKIASRLIKGKKQIRMIHAPKLPKGWVGKNHACKYGVKNAKGSYYIFIDADTRPGKDLIKTALFYTVSTQTDLLSVSPMQKIISTSERTFLPGIFFIVSGSINLRKMAHGKTSRALANGQFLLFNKQSYKKIGGHDAIKNILSEDIAFGRLAVENKMSLGFFITSRNIFSVRMYTDFQSIFEGFVKNMSDIMRIYTPFSLILSILKSLIYAVFPVVIPFAAWSVYKSGIEDQNLFYFILFLWASLLCWSVFISVIIEFKVPFYYALLLPAGIIFQIILIVLSYINNKTGKKTWKGRAYIEGSVHG